MKQDIEKEIREFIQENSGTTENKVVDHMTQKHLSSRMTTLNIIGSLKERKIIQDGQQGNSFHKLFINDESEFGKIEKELAQIERFINQGSSYFREQMTNNLADANAETLEDVEEKTLTRKIEYMNRLEFRYRETVTRMLEDIFIIGNDRLSKQDSERFYKIIIELKSKLAYHAWTKDTEITYFKVQMQNIKRTERDMKKDKMLGKYLEQSKLDKEFIKRFEERTEKFVSNLF